MTNKKVFLICLVLFVILSILTIISIVFGIRLGRRRNKAKTYLHIIMLTTNKQKKIPNDVIDCLTFNPHILNSILKITYEHIFEDIKQMEDTLNQLKTSQNKTEIKQLETRINQIKTLVSDIKDWDITSHTATDNELITFNQTQCGIKLTSFLESLLN
jgi:alanyl-tRNA synthetase